MSFIALEPEDHNRYSYMMITKYNQDGEGIRMYDFDKEMNIQGRKPLLGSSKSVSIVLPLTEIIKAPIK